MAGERRYRQWSENGNNTVVSLGFELLWFPCSPLHALWIATAMTLHTPFKYIRTVAEGCRCTMPRICLVFACHKRVRRLPMPSEDLSTSAISGSYYTCETNHTAQRSKIYRRKPASQHACIVVSMIYVYLRASACFEWWLVHHLLSNPRIERVKKNHKLVLQRIELTVLVRDERFPPCRPHLQLQRQAPWRTQWCSGTLPWASRYWPRAQHFLWQLIENSPLEACRFVKWSANFATIFVGILVK